MFPTCSLSGAVWEAHPSSAATMPSARTWLKQGAASQAPGSSSHKHCGASFPSPSLEEPLLVLTVWMLATDCVVNLWWARNPKDRSSRREQRGQEFPSSARSPVLGMGVGWGVSLSFPHIEVVIHWDVSSMAGSSAPSSTLVESDRVGCPRPLWVLTPGTLGFVPMVLLA